MIYSWQIQERTSRLNQNVSCCPLTLLLKDVFAFLIIVIVKITANETKQNYTQARWL